MDKQRIYDAMLIKAFRKDVKMADLRQWLKPYDIELEESDLMRVPKHIWYRGRVQEMVGRYLKPLADRLWDTDPSHDIKTLDWMENIQITNKATQWDKERASLMKESNHDRRRGGVLAVKWDANKRSNQWNVVK